MNLEQLAEMSKAALKSEMPEIKPVSDTEHKEKVALYKKQGLEWQAARLVGPSDFNARCLAAEQMGFKRITLTDMASLLVKDIWKGWSKESRFLKTYNGNSS